MSRGDAARLWGMRAGMELCWRYAWAAYTIDALAGREFPLPRAAATFAAAALLTRFGRGRGWRVGGVLLLHALVLGAGVLAVVHATYGVAAPWWDTRWVGPLLGRPRSVEEGLVLALVGFWAAVFWHGGVALGRRPSSHLTVCTRFDLGVAAFLALFLVRWLVRAQGGIETGGVRPELLLGSYLVFGLFAVGLARNRRDARGGDRSPAAAGGAVFAFLAGTVLVGTAAAALFLPYLTAAAHAGFAVMRTAAAPLGPPLLRLLRFLLLGRQAASGGAAGRGPGGAPGGAGAATPGGWEEWVATILAWGMGILLAAAAVAAAGAILWHLVRWLLSRTPGERGGRSLRVDLLRWAAEAGARLRAALARALRPRRAARGAVALHAALRTWGRRSGVAAAAHETPLEYGRRLQRSFPSVGEEIDRIVALFHREVYAERRCGPEDLAPGLRAWRRLSAPRLWPSRWRARWFPRGERPTRIGRGVEES